MLSNVSKACPYICLVIIVEWKGKEQLLDLALMTNYSQCTFMWTVANSLSVDSILSGLVIQHSDAYFLYKLKLTMTSVRRLQINGV